MTRMSSLSPTPTALQTWAEANLRRGFKLLNRFMLLNWRLGLGSWLNAAPGVLGRYVVLTHIGRKSGRVFRTPVNYAKIDGCVYCTAGFGSECDWYRNLMATPVCELWLPDGWYDAVVEDVTDSPDALPLLREVLIASAFAARLAGIDPRRMADNDLRTATQAYRLLKLTPTAARTGPGGPSDLAWIWPVATTGLLGILALTRRRAVKKI